MPQPDIDVRTTPDGWEPGITSIALLNSDQLLVVDWDNRTVKLVDMVQHKVLYRLSVSGIPYGICTLPDSRAAVTLPEQKNILILNCSNTLTIMNTIRVSGECKDICYCNEQLVVRYSDPTEKIEILQMNGGVVKRKSLESSSFIYQNSLSVITESKVASIIVCDYNNRRILRLDENLHKQQVYPLPNGVAPGGVLAVGENQLLVSGYYGKLWQLDSTMSRWTLLSREGFGYGGTMAFCHIRHVLYWAGNEVKRYELSWKC